MQVKNDEGSLRGMSIIAATQFILAKLSAHTYNNSLWVPDSLLKDNFV